MGCDGGTVPKRHELVKEKAKKKLPDAREVALAQWYNCTLSKNPLREPIVADAIGRMYNKDAVLEYLIDKTAYGDGDQVCPHISSLKDVVELNPTSNPAWTEEAGDLSNTTAVASRFICPVTLREMNGRHRFSYISTCGCIVSDQALREVNSSLECLKCNRPFSKQNIVPLNPPPDEAEKLVTALDQRKAAAKLAKRDKKKSKDSKSESNGNEESGTKKQKRKAEKDEGARKKASVANGSSATLSHAAAIIQAYQKEKETLGVVQSAAVRSLFTSSLSDGRSTKESFCNRGSLRQIM